jgi:hypothetical protein
MILRILCVFPVESPLVIPTGTVIGVISVVAISAMEGAIVGEEESGQTFFFMLNRDEQL